MGRSTRFSPEDLPRKLVVVVRGGVGLLLALFLGHFLVGASGVLGERNGAEDNAKAEREYEKLFHAGVLL